MIAESVSVERLNEVIFERKYNQANFDTRTDISATEFDPIRAFHFGAMGERAPSVTDCNIESVACCNSILGWG